MSKSVRITTMQYDHLLAYMGFLTELMEQSFRCLHCLLNDCNKKMQYNQKHIFVQALGDNESQSLKTLVIFFKKRVKELFRKNSLRDSSYINIFAYILQLLNQFLPCLSSCRDNITPSRSSCIGYQNISGSHV